MKYKTTYDHPELKQGLELQWNGDDEKYYSDVGFWSANQSQMNYQLDQDFVTIVQEPEFTKDQAIAVANEAFGIYFNQVGVTYAIESSTGEHLLFKEVITDLVNQRKK